MKYCHVTWQLSTFTLCSVTSGCTRVKPTRGSFWLSTILANTSFLALYLSFQTQSIWWCTNRHSIVLKALKKKGYLPYSNRASSKCVAHTDSHLRAHRPHVQEIGFFLNSCVHWGCACTQCVLAVPEGTRGMAASTTTQFLHPKNPLGQDSGLARQEEHRICVDKASWRTTVTGQQVTSSPAQMIVHTYSFMGGIHLTWL